MRFRVESLDQHYGSAQVLRQVGFEIMPGECLAVIKNDVYRVHVETHPLEARVFMGS